MCLSGGNFPGTIKDCLFISDGHSPWCSVKICVIISKLIILCMVRVKLVHVTTGNKKNIQNIKPNFYLLMQYVLKQ